MKIIKNRSRTAHYMLISLGVLFVAFALIGLGFITFIYPFEPAGKYILGLILGSVCTLVRLLILDFSVGKEVDMHEGKAKNYHQLMFFLRYGVLIATAVILVAFSNIFGVYGGVIGILCLQLSAYGANILLSRYEKKQKVLRENTIDNMPSVDVEQDNEQTHLV